MIDIISFILALIAALVMAPVLNELDRQLRSAYQEDDQP
jgi:hypothetical protein